MAGNTTRIKAVEEAFRSAIPSAFSFLSSQYGFKLFQENQYLFKARSTFCHVNIYLEWHEIVVALRPSVSRNDSESPGSAFLGLGVIINCIDPQTSFHPISVSTPEEIRKESERLAALLTKYCEPLLRGDFSLWSKLEACGDKVANKWMEEHTKRLSENKVRNARARAEEAFRKKHYREAVTAYESIEEHLSPAETKKVEFAKRKLISF